MSLKAVLDLVLAVDCILWIEVVVYIPLYFQFWMMKCTWSDSSEEKYRTSIYLQGIILSCEHSFQSSQWHLQTSMERFTLFDQGGSFSSDSTRLIPNVCTPCCWLICPLKAVLADEVKIGLETPLSLLCSLSLTFNFWEHPLVIEWMDAVVSNDATFSLGRRWIVCKRWDWFQCCPWTAAFGVWW